MKYMIVQGIGQTYNSMVQMIGEFLPRLVAMVAIILVGLLIAFILRYALRSILRFTQLDRISERSGTSQVLRRAALPSISELLSRALFWIAWIAFTLLGVSVLGIPELHDQIARLFQFLPQVFVAILILFAGLLAANFLSRAALLAAVNAGARSPRLWSVAVRFLISILALTMALEQLGLATKTVITAFSIVFGALMLALAIAFGLGGRNLAQQALEKYFGEEKNDKDKEEEPLPL